ncbi:hypothetical protein [Allorhodopirellula heiligendammensis]|uniref:Tetratricopeptide repeat protein n=1 Tax=Allorhodopirellula heiligendammensis TaxID=2714739 RepID=A0A5C6C4T3_9BACT|nr:hypothetical protein [Allorhodopirellula heiligendammensis]TWU19102.1 hypothetical protein Poly21_12730 [Allorhodopirellula heiligendammensis]
MKIRFTSIFNVLAGVIALVATVSGTTCHAQSAVLSEIYGRGVHAYNAGQYDRASEWLNMAIDNGYSDPRAYYFLGFSAAASGREIEAEGDFQKGAEIEATGAFGNSVGRALARVQGPTRMKLEQIRETARLHALAKGQARSKARYGELGASPAGTAAKPVPAPTRNAPAAKPRAVMAPAVPAGDDPFADDMDQDPVIESNDVLEGVADNAVPAEGEAAASPEPSGEGSPFDAPGGDPFANPAGGSDPFSTGTSDDPFDF